MSSWTSFFCNVCGENTLVMVKLLHAACMGLYQNCTGWQAGRCNCSKLTHIHTNKAAHSGPPVHILLTHSAQDLLCVLLPCGISDAVQDTLLKQGIWNTSVVEVWMAGIGILDVVHGAGFALSTKGFSWQYVMDRIKLSDWIKWSDQDKNISSV